MSNRAYAGMKVYIDTIGFDPIDNREVPVFETYKYGFVTDDYGELEVANGETQDNPFANVLRAQEIADEVNAHRYELTLRQWYVQHRADDDGFDYHMKED